VLMEATTGLRERKKQRTRDAIVQAAFKLFDERGFDGTTIADIAEAAEIAPRTFFSYFPSKDDVVFHDFSEKQAALAAILRDRDPGTNAFDAVRNAITDLAAEEADPSHLHQKRLQSRLIRENDSLAAHSEHLRGKIVELLAEAVAQDLGVEPDSLRPRLVAAATAAALQVIDEMAPEEVDDPMKVFESVLAFLRGGLAAMQDETRA
jgi:AcrR family transcriptional regulator